jgi:glucose/arabinose dehydrogenase
MKINEIRKVLMITVITLLTVSVSVCQNKTADDKPKTQSGTAGEKMKSPPKIEFFDKAQTYQIKPESLPKPYTSESASRGSSLVEQPANATLKLPKGFKINVFAEGDFRYPRWMTLAPNGDVFVADSRANSIVILRDTNKDGSADERFTFADNLSQPFGMAFWNDYFYIANTDSVVRFKYKNGQTKAVGTPEKIIELTEGGYNQHWTRNIIFERKC